MAEAVRPVQKKSTKQVRSKFLYLFIYSIRTYRDILFKVNNIIKFVVFLSI